MSNILLWFKDITSQITILDTIDVLIVTFLIYQLIKLTRQTRATQVLKGFGLIIVLGQISNWLELSTLAWLSNYIIDAGAIVLVILFQPELRRALERIGRGRIFSPTNQNKGEDEDEEEKSIIEEIIRAIQRMSGQHTGALIVIQNKEPLGDIIESGTELYAKVSSELLENIFTPNTPLHDGAVIINDDTIVAAGCFLPMTANPYLAQEVGTRHRAAIGLSEKTDALILIVSEETGIVSCAKSGKLIRYLDGNSVRDLLEEIITVEEDALITILTKLFKGTNNAED